MQMNLNYKVALVTGGGTGIGKAVSLELARRGACVVVNYSKSEAEAKATVHSIVNQGGQAIALQADVSKDQEVRRMVDSIIQHFGTVDLLVNNASITKHISLGDLEKATEEVWDELYAVNVKGMFFAPEQLHRICIKVPQEPSSISAVSPETRD
jgi:3-oxoacyl-[acyl-carrier protein] reductase